MDTNYDVPIEQNNIAIVENKLNSPQPNEIEMETQNKTKQTTLSDRDETIFEKEPFQIDYRLFNWILIFVITALTVIDRYTWMSYAMGVNGSIPDGADWSVTLFYIVAQVSGRMMLVSSSYIMLFENDVFWNWFYEKYLQNQSKWYFKWIRIQNIKEQHSHLHYYIGIFFIGIPVVLHVWTIIFAAVFPQNDITFLPSWKRADKYGEKIAFYANGMLTLGWNDTERLIVTSLCFFILFPYSMISVLQKRNWSVAMYLHIIAAAMYMIDLIRINSHPHTWVFNVPFIFWWMCDRIYGIFVYRRCVANLISKVVLDKNEYVILYLRVNNEIKSLSSIGDIFYLNVLDCGWDRSHPFTIFYNHNFVSSMIQQQHIEDATHKSHKFSFRPKQTSQANKSADSFKDSHSEIFINRQLTTASTASQDNIIHAHDDDNKYNLNDINESNDVKESNDWNVGVILKVHENHNGACCDTRKTWTNKILNSETRFHAGFRCWGPYRSDYNLLNNIQFINAHPLVLLSTGAGCGYMIDFYNYFTSENILLPNKVEYYFSTASIGMFQWFTNITCKKSINNFHVSAH
eukprot:357313_1